MKEPDWVTTLRQRYREATLRNITSDPLMDIFWNSIDLANEDFDRFLIKVKEMSREELILFYWIFDDACRSLQKNIYMDVVRAADPEEPWSEDDIDDLTTSVVCQGKKMYEKVVNNPESMPTEERFDIQAIRTFGKVGSEYLSRYGKPMPH